MSVIANRLKQWALKLSILILLQYNLFLIYIRLKKCVLKLLILVFLYLINFLIDIKVFYVKVFYVLKLFYVNFDENDPETIIHDSWLGIIDINNVKHVKRINECTETGLETFPPATSHLLLSETALFQMWQGSWIYLLSDAKMSSPSSQYFGNFFNSVIFV